jgi:hypothetical protein
LQMYVCVFGFDAGPYSISGLMISTLLPQLSLPATTPPSAFRPFVSTREAVNALLVNRTIHAFVTTLDIVVQSQYDGVLWPILTTAQFRQVFVDAPPTSLPPLSLAKAESCVVALVCSWSSRLCPLLQSWAITPAL